MNIYDLHSNPEELHGFDIAPYKLPKLAYMLAREKPELRPKLEPVIMKDPWAACPYAMFILKRPWPEAEPVIMKDAMRAYMYARHILKRPWSEAEPYIMKNPVWAYRYVLDILKRRWPEAEPYIMKEPYWWDFYKRQYLQKA